MSQGFQCKLCSRRRCTYYYCTSFSCCEQCCTSFVCDDYRLHLFLRFLFTPEATLPPRNASTAPDICFRTPLSTQATPTAAISPAFRQVLPVAAMQLQQHALQSTSPGAGQELPQQSKLQTLWLALLEVSHQLQRQRQRKQALQQHLIGVGFQQTAKVQQPSSSPLLVTRAVYRTKRSRALHG